MRWILIAVLFGLASTGAHADAIPPQRTLSAVQAMLVGTWQEENWTQAIWGSGHSQSRRTLIVGNDTMTIASLNGILPSNEFSTRAISGAWTASRKDTKTVIVTLDQGGGRGTELTLVFDGPNAFAFRDSEMRAAPSRFVRVGPSPVSPNR